MESIVQNNFLKPAIGAGLVLAIDKFYNKEPDMQRSLYYAGAVGAGFFFASIVAPMLPDGEFNMFFSNGRNVQERFSEIALGASGAYAVNKFVLKNELNRDTMQKRLLEIVVADIGGEMISEILTGHIPQLI